MEVLKEPDLKIKQNNQLPHARRLTHRAPTKTRLTPSDLPHQDECTSSTNLNGGHQQETHRSIGLASVQNRPGNPGMVVSKGKHEARASAASPRTRLMDGLVNAPFS